jgi:hypothetical protein
MGISWGYDITTFIYGDYIRTYHQVVFWIRTLLYYPGSEWCCSPNCTPLDPGWKSFEIPLANVGMAQ